MAFRDLACRLKEEGNEAYRARKFTTALQLYSQAESLDPFDMVYASNSATVCFTYKDYMTCVEFCRRALAVGIVNKAESKLIEKVRRRLLRAYAIRHACPFDRDVSSARPLYFTQVPYAPCSSMPPLSIGTGLIKSTFPVDFAEYPVRLLFCGVGDPRNFLCSIIQLDESITTLDVHINDYVPDVIARFILFLSLFLDDLPTDSHASILKSVDILLIWSSYGLPARLRHFLHSRIQVLYELFGDETRMASHPFTSFISFPDWLHAEPVRDVFQRWLKLTKVDEHFYHQFETHDEEEAEFSDSFGNLIIPPDILRMYPADSKKAYSTRTKWQLNPTLVPPFYDPSKCVQDALSPAMTVVSLGGSVVECIAFLRTAAIRLHQLRSGLNVYFWVCDCTTLGKRISRDNLFTRIDTSNVSDCVGVLNILNTFCDLLLSGPHCFLQTQSFFNLRVAAASQQRVIERNLYVPLFTSATERIVKALWNLELVEYDNQNCAAGIRCRWQHVQDPDYVPETTWKTSKKDSVKSWEDYIRQLPHFISDVTRDGGMSGMLNRFKSLPNQPFNREVVDMLTITMFRTFSNSLFFDIAERICERGLVQHLKIRNALIALIASLVSGNDACFFPYKDHAAMLLIERKVKLKAIYDELTEKHGLQFSIRPGELLDGFHVVRGRVDHPPLVAACCGSETPPTPPIVVMLILHNQYKMEDMPDMSTIQMLEGNALSQYLLHLRPRVRIVDQFVYQIDGTVVMKVPKYFMMYTPQSTVALIRCDLNQVIGNLVPLADNFEII